MFFYSPGGGEAGSVRVGSVACGERAGGLCADSAAEGVAVRLRLAGDLVATAGAAAER